MALIKDADKEALREIFGDRLTGPVRLVMFTQRESVLTLPASHACESCEEAEELLREVAGLSDLIEVETHDFAEEGALAEQYRIDKIPAVAVVGERDFGLRFYGVPAGYEFAAFVEAIVDASRGAAELEEATVEALAGVDQDVRIQVFVTPT